MSHHTGQTFTCELELAAARPASMSERADHFHTVGACRRIAPRTTEQYTLRISVNRGFAALFDVPRKFGIWKRRGGGVAEVVFEQGVQPGHWNK